MSPEKTARDARLCFVLWPQVVEPISGVCFNPACKAHVVALCSDDECPLAHVAHYPVDQNCVSCADGRGEARSSWRPMNQAHADFFGVALETGAKVRSPTRVPTACRRRASAALPRTFFLSCRSPAFPSCVRSCRFRRIRVRVRRPQTCSACINFVAAREGRTGSGRSLVTRWVPTMIWWLLSRASDNVYEFESAGRVALAAGRSWGLAGAGPGCARPMCRHCRFDSRVYVSLYGRCYVSLCLYASLHGEARFSRTGTGGGAHRFAC